MNNNVYEEILNNSNIRTILEYYGLNVNKNKWWKCYFFHTKI